jgi:hypothetical protein
VGDPARGFGETSQINPFAGRHLCSDRAQRAASAIVAASRSSGRPRSRSAASPAPYLGTGPVIADVEPRPPPPAVREQTLLAYSG